MCVVLDLMIHEPCGTKPVDKPDGRDRSSVLDLL